ncbi:YqhG family protein [Bacillus sp. Marseille-P3800]|uniref:YqhG family protein n=1 Tax=Bacillus sp. Marseille-P3800 TaxID=2014782 RepID=UPI000C06A8CF|nr:YqhG family protein [Bacillus sp. Marseille-P3800]
MNQLDIHQYLKRYFLAHDSSIVEESPAHLTVKLSIKLDKALMNRPFYWHYQEKIGSAPNPMTITLITDQNRIPEDLQGEVIHFGSPRLSQIFDSANELGAFIRMYESAPNLTTGSHPLHPWLAVNANISFQCDRKKDVLLSLGLNLINGQIVPQFFDKVDQLTLTPKIPDYCFTLSPLVKLESGLKRLQKVMKTYIENEPTHWAAAAHTRWANDEQLLESFYEGTDDKPESYFAEKDALQERYEPHIHVSIVNGGIFYLHQQMFQS